MELKERLKNKKKKLEIYLQKTSLMSFDEKFNLLKKKQEVQIFLSHSENIREFYNHSTDSEKFILLSSIFLDQMDRLFHSFNNTAYEQKKMRQLLENLNLVEHFYQGVGGLIGYHAKTLELILSKIDNGEQVPAKIEFERSYGIDFSKDETLKNKLALFSIQNLEVFAEVYPIGGAGDRLGLLSDDGCALPAAKLGFGGKTLVEGLIRDLEAKEYLYFKLFGKQIITPIALMTSFEKDNYQYIQNIFDSENWFGRGKENFRIFIQPLVPVLTVEGNWQLKNPFEVVFKPGGHGMIWKLALEDGVFEWLEERKRKKALIRQINNPIAGYDNGVLAFCAVGLKEDKDFGFLSCQRLVGSAEGVLVLAKETDKDGLLNCHITNLEYVDFEKYGLKDEPQESFGKYSHYPSNTNLLFFDIQKIKAYIQHQPIPGLLVNIKEDTEFEPFDALFKKTSCARLESTMQNIVDCMRLNFKKNMPSDLISKNLNSFVVYNDRSQTISVTKKAYIKGKPLAETPEGAFFDLLKLNLELLKTNCGFCGIVPLDERAYVEEKLGQFFYYNPSLGPFVDIIKQKIRGGFLANNSELQLDIAEADIENLHIEGSLIVEAKNPIGQIKDNKLCLGLNTGKLELINTKIVNRGRSKHQEYPLWKNRINRDQSLTIILEGDAEFFAKDVTFKGDIHIFVPFGQRAIAINENEDVVIYYQTIKEPTWNWKHEIIDDQIKLSKVVFQNLKP
jgi:hypothetical protein